MPFSIALSAFDIATLIAVIGVLACLVAVIPRDADGTLARRLWVMLGSTLALLTLASFGILLSRTLELNGDAWGTLWRDMRLALAVTHFGHVWWWRVPALALLWIGWSTCARRPGTHWIRWLMVPAVAAIALTRSETGHPADHGDLTLSVWIDWLHLLAAGAWVGSLFGITLAVFPRLLRTGNASPRHAAQIFQRLSTLSAAALAVLIACGIYNAVRQLGSLDALWTTRYGINLDVKLVLVLVMILIGAHNRYVKLPRLLKHAGMPGLPSLIAGRTHRRNVTARKMSATETLRSCARAVLLESLLGIAVIGATGSLLHAMPPADARSMHGMQVSTHPTESRAVVAQGFEVEAGAAR